MTENQTNNQVVQPPAYMDEREAWREQRRAMREERRAARPGNGAWIGGAILVLLGLVFLAQNTGLFILHNWWALFILIPAFGSYAAAYGIYRGNGNHLSYAVRGTLIGGIFFTLLSAAFLFDVAAGLFWPLLLIVLGVSLLLNYAFPQRAI
jgi:hypothetical protein